MYFSRVRLSPQAEGQPSYWRLLGDGYRLHQLVWALFADRPETRRDFIYRLDRRTVYAVSARPPADPAEVWEIETKPYRPRLAQGQILAFSLRANPIVAKRDEAGRLHRHDVVMEAKTKGRSAGHEPEPRPDLVTRAGLAWLDARAEAHGFAIQSGNLKVSGYQQHHFSKRGADRPIRLSTLDFEGLLRVKAPELFEKVLFTGLGPAKGFGCGLILVKRP